MNINKATELKNKNKHLIGQKYRGGTIEELIIRPTNEKEFNAFIQSYLRTMDANISIQPFLTSDLTVDVVCDRAKIQTNGIFFRTELKNLLDEKLDVKF